MPVVFLFSAIVSGIALVLILYMVTSLVRCAPGGHGVRGQAGELPASTR